MKKTYKFIICIIIICIVFSGCFNREKSFVIPLNYSSNTVVKIYTDNAENNYNVNVTCKDNNYDFLINNETIFWGILYNEDKCVMKNNKFKDDDIVINNLKIKDILMSEFDLSKFKYEDDNKKDKITYFDGVYKHVLMFGEKNVFPNKIFIYKNNNLVKTIEYLDFNVEQL